MASYYKTVPTVSIYMAQAPTRVIAGGRVTVPAHIRDDLGLEEGDYVLVDVRPLSPEVSPDD